MPEKNKKNCLLILPRDIFPVVSGYALKNEALIKGLAKQYNLLLIVISSRKPNEDETSFYKRNSTEFHYFYFNKNRYYLNALLGLLSSYPLQSSYFYFSRVQKCVNDILGRTDIAIGALVRTMKYLENCPSNMVKLFDMVDSFGLIYQNSVNNVDSLFWKFLYKIESKRLLKYEKKCIETSSLTYLFSNTEKVYWEKCSEKVKWVPYGIKNFLFSYGKHDDKYKDSVAFIGRMDYRPNIDAVVWYVKNVHCNLKNRPQLYILGAFPTEEVKALSDRYTDIEVTGFIEDPYIILNSAKAVIAPMQTGGGIQTKILEAMALGKVVISSTKAVLPIYGAENEKNLIIADNLEEYETAYKKLSDESICLKIGNRARELVSSTYTWDNYIKNYIMYLEKL